MGGAMQQGMGIVEKVVCLSGVLSSWWLFSFRSVPFTMYFLFTKLTQSVRLQAQVHSTGIDVPKNKTRSEKILEKHV